MQARSSTGRAPVSKTGGCGFKSCLTCQVTIGAPDRLSGVDLGGRVNAGVRHYEPSLEARSSAVYRSADGMPVLSDGVRRGPAGGLQRGDRVARLEIPRLGLAVAVLHGVEEENLRVGAGHVPGTPLPGAEGNSAVAAHRDTHFRKLEQIQVGDRIQVSRPTGTFEFVVESIQIVEPANTSVLETHRAGSDLTLITCYPFRFIGSAPERFIVQARRVSL